ncbi:MAG: hypothetical protein ICV69_07740 [Thermoleophilaceae bacterium]|nr:hypothetical protein [Thermoleophilaceae bacterium]
MFAIAAIVATHGSAQATATCFGEPARTVVTGTILFVGSSADEVMVGDAANSAGAAK